MISQVDSSDFSKGLKMKIHFYYIIVVLFGLFDVAGANSCKVTDSLISDKYEGECAGGMATGFGNASGKAVYIGEFLNGKKHGIGLYKWPNGESAEVEWKNDRFDGIGIYYWLDGSRYEGSFKNGKREGKGVYYWPDGSSYEGEWHDWIAADTGTLEDSKKSRDPESAKIGAEAKKIAARVKSMVAFITSSIIAGAFDKENTGQAGHIEKTREAKDDLPVEKIQKYLFLLDYDIGKIDGILGDKTLAAIKKFRIDSGLEGNGGIDEAFLRILKERLQKNI